jgi:hypothetical protein
MPFAQRENIHAFCEAAKLLGVKDINNFTADDLFEVWMITSCWYSNILLMAAGFS